MSYTRVFSDGHVVALSTETGKVVWDKRFPRERSRFYDVVTSPYNDDVRVIVGTFDGKVRALDRVTGDTQWTFSTGAYGGFYGDATRIFFSGLDGNFYALKKTTGEVIWKKPFGKGVGMAPVKIGDYLVVTTSADPVYVLDPATGEVKGRTRLGTGTLSSVMSGTGDNWFYCQSNYGNVFAFQLKKLWGFLTDFETIAPEAALFKSTFSNHENPGTT